MADGLFGGGGAYFGNPNIARQGVRARELAQQRDVNTLPDPRTFGFVSGLLGTAPDQLGMSVLNPNAQAAKDAAYYGYQAGNALQIAPAVAGIVRGAKAIPAMVNEMRSTPLPLEWYHGTTPEGAQAIRQSGQFNPNAGKRTYEYSELGPNTVYFAPEGSWWLDPAKAEAGRAASYNDQVAMRLAKDAKVKVIDSPAQFDKIAKSVGYKDGKELRDALWADNLGERKYAEQVRQGSFDDFLKNRINEMNKFPNANIKSIEDAAQQYGMSPKDWMNFQKETYDSYVNFESQYEKANQATQNLLKKGIDGLYFSPKFADKAFKQEYMGTVAGDQLGIFRPEIAKVVDNPRMSMPENPAYKDPFADTTR
jgi:hypothetical protein